MNGAHVDNSSPSLTIAVPMDKIGRIPTGCGRKPAAIVTAAVLTVPGIIRATPVTNAVDIDGKPALLVVAFRQHDTSWERLLPQATSAIESCWGNSATGDPERLTDGAGRVGGFTLGT